MNNLYISRTEKTIDIWETPVYFFDLLNQEFHFTLDAAASKSNAKCKKFYTKEENGLIQDWQGETVFVNPPFSHIKEWVKKCYEESKKEKTKVVLIIPPRIDTEYWHNYVFKAREIRDCKGRVNFLINGEKPENGSPFPLCVVIFEKHSHEWPKLRPFYHKEKDLITYRKLDDFCRDDTEKDRERQLICNNGGKPRQKQKGGD